LVSDGELLAAIAGDAGETLLQRFGCLAAALGADRYELGRIGGPDLAWTFAVVQECASRMGRASLTRRCLLSSYPPVLAYLTTTMAWRGREQFRVLFLDKNYVHPMIMRSRSDASGSFVAADQ
jgi:DNA repair protein RadC